MTSAARFDGAVLSREEVMRYSRHLLLPEVGMRGQERLRKGSVLLVGAGGLGSPAALYLAAAGVGRIGLVDFDVVDESNLQRQILHDSRWLGKPKLESAADRLHALNPHVEVVLFPERLTAGNAFPILDGFDVVLDGTDNFATRYLTNDACFLAGKPNVYGSIFRFEGQVSVFWPGKGPCYRCLYPAPPPPGLVPSCAEGGVLGVLPGVIGSLQATEAIKILLGVGRSLAGRLVLYDALDLSFRELKLEARPRLPALRREPDDHGARRLRRASAASPAGRTPPPKARRSPCRAEGVARPRRERPDPRRPRAPRDGASARSRGRA